MAAGSAGGRAAGQLQHGRQVSAFEFVLRHERGCQVVAVYDCPELRAFLRERGLECIAL
ncbi:MAG: hypothetical protein M3R61_10730 [Chloroflexota bacterium]|nr:hypothetical protein [Chloroflexota bacterium]